MQQMGGCMVVRNCLAAFCVYLCMELSLGIGRNLPAICRIRLFSLMVFVMTIFSLGIFEYSRIAGLTSALGVKGRLIQNDLIVFPGFGFYFTVTHYPGIGFCGFVTQENRLNEGLSSTQSPSLVLVACLARSF